MPAQPSGLLHCAFFYDSCIEHTVHLFIGRLSSTNRGSWLVAWHSGDWQTFPVLCSTYSWWV